MHNKRICMAEGCGKEFEAKKGNQMYCSRKCFKRSYYLRKKSEQESNGFPSYKCPGCLKDSTLDFSPIDNFDKWIEYKCPHCGLDRASAENMPTIVEIRSLTVVTVTGYMH